MKRPTILLVLSVLVGAAASAGLTSAAAAATANACSTKGLSFHYTSGTATYGDKVASLKATGASCAIATSLAAAAAKKLLHKQAVPAKIDGFTVHVKSPCSGCTPVWHVTASKGMERITFEVLGGA